MPLQKMESRLGAVSYLLLLCECLYTVWHLKGHQTPMLGTWIASQISVQCPGEYAVKIYGAKKIYLRLMWSSVSKVASKLLGKCLCGRLASPGPLIIQVRDLLAAQSGGFPACTPEFPFHKRNCSFFQRNILLNLSSCQGRFGQNVFLLHTKNVATEVDFIIRSDF